VIYSDAIPAAGTGNTDSGPDGGNMQFYNLKTRSHVEIPDSDVKKKK
jgi:hypothetical protein